VEVVDVLLGGVIVLEQSVSEVCVSGSGSPVALGQRTLSDETKVTASRAR
jgi:hypothetical protein